jgi:hypothetical protein
MTANVTFSPYLTSVGQGLFNATSTGARQGTAYPDPSTRYRLRSGWLSNTETLPMWGGVGLYQYTPTGYGTPIANPNSALGVQVGRATALTGSKPLTAFSVFDQDYAMITSPQSTVPLIGSYGAVALYPLGSLARIWVAADPALASTFNVSPGASVNTQVSWDFVNQLLVPYTGTLTISSGTYNNTTGVVTLVMSATVGFSAGDAIIISGLTGTGAFASLDGTFTALTASGTGVTYQAASGLGATTITGGSLTLGSGANAALAVDVLQVETTNNMTVVYSSATGFATWNYNGALALIEI